MENREGSNQVHNCFKRFKKELTRCIKEILMNGSLLEIIPDLSVFAFNNPENKSHMFSSLFHIMLDVSSYKETIESYLEGIDSDVENDNIGQFTYTDIQYLLKKNVLGEFLTKKYQLLLDNGEMNKSNIIDFVVQVKEKLRDTFTFKEFDDLLNSKNIDYLGFIDYLTRTLRNVYDDIVDDEQIDYDNRTLFHDMYNQIGEYIHWRYFSYEDGKIKFGPSKVPENFDRSSPIYSLCKDLYREFSAVMIENKDSTIVDGDIYVGGKHVNIFHALLMNGVDLNNAIRIVDNSYLPDAENPFEISNIAKFGGEKVNIKLSDNELTYFGKRRLRKIIEYLRTVKPDLTKQELCDIFMDAEGFGYDFISTCKGNFPVDFNLGMENLRDVMSVLDEYFPYDECTDLVEKFKEREKNSYEAM